MSIRAEQFAEFRIEGVTGPGDEASPVVLELLPDDLDQIQFGTIGRQINQKCPMVDQPAIQHVLGQMMVDAGVIQDNERQRSGRDLLEQSINEADKHIPGNGVRIGCSFQGLCAEIQCPQHRTRAVLRGLSFMGFAQRRPRTLYRRRSTERGLIVIEQPQIAPACRGPRARQQVLLGSELFFGAFFLSEKRVRLNEKPRVFNPLLNVTRQHGREH